MGIICPGKWSLYIPRRCQGRTSSSAFVSPKYICARLIQLYGLGHERRMQSFLQHYKFRPKAASGRSDGLLSNQGHSFIVTTYNPHRPSKEWRCGTVCQRIKSLAAPESLCVGTKQNTVESSYPQPNATVSADTLPRQRLTMIRGTYCFPQTQH